MGVWWVNVFTINRNRGERKGNENDGWENREERGTPTGIENCLHTSNNNEKLEWRIDW